MIGSEYVKPEGLAPLEGVDYGDIATAYADYPDRAIPILNDQNVKELLTFIFTTIPQSDIQYGELRLRINGRLDDTLEGVINESISIAKMLHKHRFRITWSWQTNRHLKRTDKLLAQFK